MLKVKKLVAGALTTSVSRETLSRVLGAIAGVLLAFLPRWGFESASAEYSAIAELLESIVELLALAIPILLGDQVARIFERRRQGDELEALLERRR